MFGSLTGTEIVYYVITILISLPIHEAMHGFAAHWLGDTTAADQGRLTLNPLKHIDPFATVLLPIITIVLFGFPFLAAKPVPFNPYRLKFNEFGAAIVAAAGPLSNLLLAIVGALVIRLTNGTFLDSFISIFVVLNVALFIFNLFPIPPLDGSRVLYAFAPEPLQKIMASMERYGLFIVFGIILLFGSGFTSLLGHLENSVLNLLP
jgi:Zn-dependent protease